MAERTSGEVKSAPELILQKLRDTFDRNGNVLENPDSAGNVWLMLAAIVPYKDSEETQQFLPFGAQPPNGLQNETVLTHIARVVLRTTDARQGTNDYVDGTGFCFLVDEAAQTADFVWEEEAFGDGPKFHGGDVPSAIEWLKALADEPAYSQFKDPFLTPHARAAARAQRARRGLCLPG